MNYNYYYGLLLLWIFDSDDDYITNDFRLRYYVICQHAIESKIITVLNKWSLSQTVAQLTFIAQIYFNNFYI